MNGAILPTIDLDLTTALAWALGIAEDRVHYASLVTPQYTELEYIRVDDGHGRTIASGVDDWRDWLMNGGRSFRAVERNIAVTRNVWVALHAWEHGSVLVADRTRYCILHLTERECPNGLDTVMVRRPDGRNIVWRNAQHVRDFVAADGDVSDDAAKRASEAMEWLRAVVEFGDALAWYPGADLVVDGAPVAHDAAGGTA